LAFRAFRRIRAQGKDILSSHSSLTNSRYIRLMLLGTIDAIASTAFQLWILIGIFNEGVNPWTSFKDIHADISVVLRSSAQQWRSGSDAADIELSRWLWVICASLFFAFFGFSDEARKHYRYVMSLAGSYVGVPSGSYGTHSSSSRYVI